MKVNFALFFLIVFGIISCTSSENNKLIIGSWIGSEWLINRQPSNLHAAGTTFTFNNKGEYTSDYPGTKEAGTYKVEKDMLFTTPEKQQEIMVKINNFRLVV